MSYKKYLIFSIIIIIIIIPVFTIAGEVYVAGVVYSEKRNDCLSVIEDIEVIDLTYDLNSNKKIGETDEYGLYLVDVNPTNDGYLLELRDPKGIHDKENIQGPPDPNKQRKSKKLDSKEHVGEWDYERVKQKINQEVGRYFYIRKKFPRKTNWHKAVRRLVNQNLDFLEKNLKPDVQRLAVTQILKARKDIENDKSMQLLPPALREPTHQRFRDPLRQ